MGPGGRGRPRRPFGRPPHRRLRASIPRPGDMRPRPMHFCGYAPGDAPSVLPEGTAKRIPAGADLHLPGPLHARTARSGPTAPRSGSSSPRPSRPARRSRSGSPTPTSCSRPAPTTSPSPRRWCYRPTRAALELHAPHAPAGQGLQVHGHQARRVAPGRALGAGAMTSAGRPTTSSPKPMTCPRGRGSTAWPTSTTRIATRTTPTRPSWCAGASRPSRK